MPTFYQAKENGSKSSISMKKGIKTDIRVIVP
jgi:hypothetical protein